MTSGVRAAEPRRRNESAHARAVKSDLADVVKRVGIVMLGIDLAIASASRNPRG
jgi:hypothetical protein